MYEQEYKRGQIYDVGGTDLMPGEMATVRPGLIISSDAGNRTNPAVTVAFTTTVAREKSINYGPIRATGKLSYVACNQLQTVSKKRLGKLMGQLSENEMLEVDKCLEEALDLGYVDDTPLKEKEKEIEILKIQLKELQEQPKESQDARALRVEVDMWKGLYEKALDMLTEKRLASDLEQRKPEPVRVEEPVQQKVDINSAKFDELKKVGFSNNQVLSIINGRPYEKTEDLKKKAGITAIAYNLAKDKICCVVEKSDLLKAAQQQEQEKKKAAQRPEQKKSEPVQPMKTKVNVNTASVEEMANTGMGECTAIQIERWRRKYGKFAKVEDLTKVPRFGPRCLEKYGKMLEV